MHLQKCLTFGVHINYSPIPVSYTHLDVYKRQRELTARVKANLRRTAAENASAGHDSDTSSISSGDLVINTERYEVQKRGEVIEITLREFELLKFLATQPQKIFTRCV